MTPAQISKIMALVVHYAQQYHNHMTMPQTAISPAFDAARAAVEAALRDAPQSEPMRAHVEAFAAGSGWKKEDGEGAFEFVQRKCYRQGWEDGRREALGDVHRDTPETPSAPTAVEPTAEEVSVVEPDERAEFEAWAGPITALAKENGKYVEVMTSLAWEAWQARASKGTPL